MVNRYECFELLASWMDDHMLTVTSRGGNARDWAFLREKGANFHSLNLGMCLPFALGLSLVYPKRKVIAVDSDGSLLLDVSSLVTAAAVGPPNLLALVFDNESYAAMGPTATAGTADLEQMARGAGIKATGTIRTLDEFKASVRKALESDGLGFFVVKIAPGKARATVDSRRLHGRPMKEIFVDQLRRHPDYPGSKKALSD